MNSKAIAILIICLGVIALIASAALGSIFDQNEVLAGWPAQAGAATASPVLARTAAARNCAAGFPFEQIEVREMRS